MTIRLLKTSMSWGWITALCFLLVSLRSSAAAPLVQLSSCDTTYIVQSNDWLSKVADKFLGDLHAYPAIVLATNEKAKIDSSFAQILNPDLIELGWKLCIPKNVEAENLLTQIIRAPVVATPTKSIVSVDLYTLDDFVAEFSFSPDVKPEWIYTSPDVLATQPILPDHQVAYEAYGYRANYWWNEHLSNSYYTNLTIFKIPLDEVKLYKAPWGSAFPRYRYPVGVTLPTGLTTNNFGWRGSDIDFDKPSKTIRIAAVGASTTVGGHRFPYSYPELLQHWLNLWAQSQKYNATFEVINTGREGIGSKDIATIVRYEVLPMDADYVIYYEGSNQFNVRSMISYSAEEVLGQPPEGLVPNLANLDSEDKTLLDKLSEYSALAARARNIVEQFSVTGGEPPKPEQQFVLPPGLDELKPDRENLGNALALRKILLDLDQMKGDLDKHNIKFLISTFHWFAYDNMILDPTRHRSLYIYLNRVYWPISYANMRRMADFQNRVFKMWAVENRVPVIEVAEQMPPQPDLYNDAIHNRPLGIRLRAWLNFEALIPFLKQDIETGRLPRSDQVFLESHPYISDNYTIRVLTEAGIGESHD